MTRTTFMALALGASLMAAGAVRAADPPPFTDTRWALTEFAGETFDEQKTNAHVIFRGNGKFSGYAFCNSMFSIYAVDGDKLAIKPIGTTMRACVDAADNEREQAFLKALRDARAWGVEGDRLTLVDGDGAVLLRFAAQTQ
ncbi:MAG: META domain-containing protein [Rhizobiales bacterium]|nr:META domain-containing protein [Hyphomicrobiales bacterium]MBN9010777.1 META domain-containing protein [Hyphomicrobiales bacterium]